MKVNSKKNIFAFIRDDLRRLEEYLARFSKGLDGILEETVKNTLMAGGKRIRPGLFFICSKGENFNIDFLLPAAASIEIVHTASLIHDDIIDKSMLRRGKKTIHNIYDNNTARFVGDYLFTHTFYLLNKYKNPRILEEMSLAAHNLVRGEFDQIKTKKLLTQGESVYLKKIIEKTSSLFKVSCVLGGILSDLPENEIKDMQRFGEYLGISFQINDDLLDIDNGKIKNSIGKPTGNDIRQGNITLPLIYALKGRKFRNRIRSIFEKEVISEEDMKQVLAMLSVTGAIDKARQRLSHYLSEARKIACSIKGKERREGLVTICDYFRQEAGRI